ncbi:MAG: glucosamine-6-phosphate deaminase [Planctomycetes bacterium]|nr:glucosamine-6-phosphate deaminase [Planctomycetota bacterium]
MKVIVLDSREEAAVTVSDEILVALRQKPDLVLGLATGSTPTGVYARLVQAHVNEGVDFSRVSTFNLDEYLGLPASHACSYRHFMKVHLFDHINVRPENIHFPPTEGEQLVARCAEYEQSIDRLGGIDIQLLGIGSNGHIGFNEPTSSLASRTRIKTLTEKTLKDNSRFYVSGESPPRLASTMGIGTILGAKHILLQAFGERKANAVQAAIEGAVSALWPASALQLHANTSFYLDRESASGLTMLDYYQSTNENDRELRRRGLL